MTYFPPYEFIQPLLCAQLIIPSPWILKSKAFSGTCDIIPPSNLFQPFLGHSYGLNEEWLTSREPRATARLLGVVVDGPEPLLIPLQLCLADLPAIEKLQVLLRDLDQSCPLKKNVILPKSNNFAEFASIPMSITMYHVRVLLMSMSLSCPCPCQDCVFVMSV